MIGKKYLAFFYIQIWNLFCSNKNDNFLWLKIKAGASIIWQYLLYFLHMFFVANRLKYLTNRLYLNDRSVTSEKACSPIKIIFCTGLSSSFTVE